MADRVHRIVKLVDEGLRRGDIKRDDVIIAHLINMLDERTQGIAVSGNDDALTRGNRGLNHFFPVGNDAGDRVFEAFGCGNEFRIDVSIPGICERTAGIPLGQRIGGRRRHGAR